MHVRKSEKNSILFPSELESRKGSVVWIVARGCEAVHFLARKDENRRSEKKIREERIGKQVTNH